MNALAGDEVRGARDLHVNRSPAPLSTKTQASVFLDLLRGVAALIVLVSHWRNFLFQDYPLVSAHTPALSLFYLFTSAGHQAVVIFFVLSGYLISGSIFRMAERGKWSWGTYLLHRVTRLWVVLVPGLLLCLFWDRLGLSLHLAPALYGGAYYNHMTLNVQAALTPRILIENLFFMQGIAGRAMLGSDGALWSLANEFWYYLLFPFGLAALWAPRNSSQRFASASTRLLCAALFVLIAWFVRGGILWMFPVWLGGTLLHLAPPLKLRNRSRVLAAVAYVPVLYFLAKWPGLDILKSDYLLTLATFALLYIWLSANQPVRPGPGEAFSRNLARFSYTLYIVHMPFLLFLTAFVEHDRRWLPTPGHLVEALGVLLLTLAYAYAVASVTEFHTDDVRRWIEGKLSFGFHARRNNRPHAVSRV